jgi:hypothetical protein
VTFLSSQRCETSTYQSEAQDVCPTCPQEAFELGANQSKTIQAFQAAIFVSCFLIGFVVAINTGPCDLGGVFT